MPTPGRAHGAPNQVLIRNAEINSYPRHPRPTERNDAALLVVMSRLTQSIVRCQRVPGIKWGARCCHLIPQARSSDRLHRAPHHDEAANSLDTAAATANERRERESDQQRRRRLRNDPNNKKLIAGEIIEIHAGESSRKPTRPIAA
jgi:hypothetical protein